MASAGVGGSISPSGVVTVNADDDQSFTVTVLVNAGYKILDVLVDGVSVRPVDTYTSEHVLSTSIL